MRLYLYFNIYIFPWEIFPMGFFSHFAIWEKNPMGFFDFLKLLISEKIWTEYIQWTYNYTIIVKLYIHFNIYFFPWEIFPMGIFSHFARWEFFPAGLFSHGKKFLWDFSKIVSFAQMSCNCDLDCIICILLHLLINYIPSIILTVPYKLKWDSR